MEFKNFAISELKAIDNADEPGTFEAIVSVFGNVDRGGDRVKKGAFARTLKERGFPPVVWSHEWGVPPIGTVTEAAENNEGLRIKGRLFVGEGEDSPMARAVYTAMKAKDGNGQAPLKEFSFGYETVGSSMEEKDGEKVRILEDLELFEVGPTLVGMNDATRLIGVKSAERAMAKEIAAELEQPPAAQEQEPEDKPPPKDEPSEEERARIAELVTARPHHD